MAVEDLERFPTEQPQQEMEDIMLWENAHLHSHLASSASGW